MKLPTKYHTLYAETLERANRAAPIGHRQATERALADFEAGEYMPKYGDLDDEAAMELLNEVRLTGRADCLRALAGRLIESHRAAGKFTLNADEALAAAVRDEAIKTDATKEELSELSESFRRWCGFGRFSPPCFYWPEEGPGEMIRAGDVVWLINRTPAQLAAWLAEALKDLRANA